MNQSDIDVCYDYGGKAGVVILEDLGNINDDISVYLGFLQRKCYL